MTNEEKLNEAEKAVRMKETGTPQEKVEQALDVCRVWYRDESGEYKKDCYRCCYWDDEDIAALMCGERLKTDALDVIRKQKKRIEDLETTVRTMSNELAKARQREWNG